MSDTRDIAIVFPHQLFAEHPALEEQPSRVYLIEDALFFGDRQHPMRFHKQKLAYHHATMAHYRRRLEGQGFDVTIVRHGEGSESMIAGADASPDTNDAVGDGLADGQAVLDALCHQAAGEGVRRVVIADPHDFLLRRRLRKATRTHGLQLVEHVSPAFINDPLDNRDWRAGRKRWFMADFYRWQRKRLDILMDGEQPLGGQWSFDEENRKKMPKAEIAQLPTLPAVARDAVIDQAVDRVKSAYPDNPGRLDTWYYPTTHAAASIWLDRFLEQRFEKFGPYEDAIVRGESWLHHGVLTPMLNLGLLTPGQVIERTLAYADRTDVPLNSVEGFVRQVIGWREFMRATYDELSVPMRTTNHWNHQRRLPAGFWDASTGIEPVDDVIERVLDTGYCHHIERLMVIGGFMFLCEIDPDDVYRWFMEMFIDSYDWVMVPNAYAMSQHADGGGITTKPYFSGSNYIRKMSNWGKGEWMATWDGLFWRWIHNHAESLAGNPRWSMMVRNVERMDASMLSNHLANADAYLTTLDER